MTTTPDPQDERDAEISRLRQLLGIGVDRDQWDAIAEAEGARFEYEQTDDNLVGYLAYRYEDIKAQRHILLREIEEAKAEQPQDDGDARAVALTAERERIALDLERTSNSLDQDAERYADERSPILQAQAEALWDAAQQIRNGAARDAKPAACEHAEEER